MTQYIAINNEQDQTFKLEHPSGSGALTVTSKEIYDAIHPRTLTETAIFTGIDNKIVMPGIVSALGLEVGDVIRIDTGAYNKLHTVESITNNGSIIVNYEHAGNRGDGSLKLPNFTGQATVTRIAKWFNAPIGLGQAWVVLTTTRAAGVEYTNTLNRAMILLIVATLTTTQAFVITGVNGSPMGGFNPGAGSQIAHAGATIPHFSVYSMVGTGTINSWSELR